MGLRQLGTEVRLRQLDFEVVVRYNSYGFRDSSFDPTPPADARTVLFLGDSFVEGHGVEEEDRFSNLLIDRLRQRYDTAWRGVNAGQIATEPIDYFHNLIDFGVALGPELVIMTIFVGNDFMGGRTFSVPEDYQVNMKGLAAQRSTGSIARSLGLRHMAALLGVGLGENEALVRRPRSRDFWSFYFDRPIDKAFYTELAEISAEAFDRYCKNMSETVVRASLAGEMNPAFLLEALGQHKALDSPEPETEPAPFYNAQDVENVLEVCTEVRSLLDQRDIGFLLVVMPDVFQIHRRESEAFLFEDLDLREYPPRLKSVKEMHANLIQGLEEDRIPYLDCTESLTRAAGRTYYIRDQHLNPNGHRVVALAIEEYLLRNGTSVLGLDLEGR